MNLQTNHQSGVGAPKFSKGNHGSRISRGRAMMSSSSASRWSFLVVSLLLWIGSSSQVVDAFAKKKSGGKNPKTSSTVKGFGAPPPTLEEVLSKFPTRMPASPATSLTPCPCGSSKTYANCCGPLHDGTQKCTSMTDVLRSRYSAFSWRLIGHILTTTHPTCRDYRQDKIQWAQDLNKAGMFDSFEFVELKILQDEELKNENEGFMEFQATLRGRDGDDIIVRGGGQQSTAAVAGLETIIQERSRFLRDPETGVWSYASGDVTSNVAGLEDTKLNN